jgi:hypothetical protein
VKSTELLALLTEFYRDRLALRNRHVAAAAHIADYNVNNTYQYVINRADGHVRWLQDAIVDMGGTPEELPLPDVASPGKSKDAVRSIITADRDGARSLADKWGPRIEALPNARHKTMLHLMLGEVREQRQGLKSPSPRNPKSAGSPQLRVLSPESAVPGAGETNDHCGTFPTVDLRGPGTSEGLWDFGTWTLGLRTKDRGLRTGDSL